MALERKRRDVVLIVRDQIYRLEPCDQRQLGTVKRGTRAQRRLCPALRALPVFSPIGNKHRVPPPAGAQAHKPLRPACALQDRLALHFGSKALTALTQRHTALKLNLVLGHRRILVPGFYEDCAPPVGLNREPPQLSFSANCLRN